MKTTTTVRIFEPTPLGHVTKREIQLPGTGWRIGDTFRMHVDGLGVIGRVIQGRDKDGVLVAGW